MRSESSIPPILSLESIESWLRLRYGAAAALALAEMCYGKLLLLWLVHGPSVRSWAAYRKTVLEEACRKFRKRLRNHGSVLSLDALKDVGFEPEAADRAQLTPEQLAKLRSVVEQLEQALTERQLAVWKLRFVAGASIHGTAKALHLYRMQVQRAEAEILEIVARIAVSTSA